MASSFLGLAARDIRDQLIPIEELGGSEGVRFREAVLRAQGVRQMLDEVQAVLVKRASVLRSASEQNARHAVEFVGRHASTAQSEHPVRARAAGAPVRRAMTAQAEAPTAEIGIRRQGRAFRAV